MRAEVLSAVLSGLFSRHRGLAWAGAVNVVAAGACFALALIDETTVLGVDRWVKPLKFTLSVAIYLWSIAWFLPYLRISRRVANFLGWAIALTMLAENALIVLQAARGTSSHFNVETGFDASVFSTMGSLIAVNTVLVVILLALFSARSRDAPRPWLWAIRFGLLLLLLGSAEGGVMIARGAHTVGAEDGGPGLPVLTWSTTAGDLRPAHLIGLHGLQILPLLAFFLGRSRLPEPRQTAIVFALASAYALLGFALFIQALQARPLLG